MTQEVLAERAEISADTVRRLEQDSFSPSLVTLIKASHGLRIDLGSLLTVWSMNEIGSDIELLSLARTLTPAERLLAIRVLGMLAQLLDGIGGRDHG